MILQMICVCQIHMALQMRAYYQLTLQMMVKVFTMDVLFQVAAAVKGPQAGLSGQCFTAKAKYTLSGFTFNQDGI